jgi:hypothetical protein
MLRTLLLLTTFFNSGILLAQNGVLTGKLYDAVNGEGLIGANVYLTDNVTVGTITDFEGNFSFSVPAGNYSVTASYIGYDNMVRQGVVVGAGQTVTLVFPMGESSIKMEEVVIETKRTENTEIAILAQRRNAVAVMDGISGQEISRSTSSNVGDAVKQVTGASVEGGKYMVVRGLGDRYSITQLNGVTLPSTDPYRNATSLDLIPAFMLDNVMTTKTFTPDQPGSFTGGNMNIKTKSFPDKLFVNLGISTSYNTLGNLQKGIIARNGGSDQLPDMIYDQIRLPANESVFGFSYRFYAKKDYIKGIPGAEDKLLLLNEVNQTLNTPLTLGQMNTPLNYSASASVGNNLKIGENKLGYVLGIRYSKSYSYYENGLSARFITGGDQLQRLYEYSDQQSEVNETVGAFANIAYQFAKNHEISVTGMFNQGNRDLARYQEGVRDETGTANLFQTRTQGFSQRDMINGQLNGKHRLANGKLKVEWTAGVTGSGQYEPDLRFFANHVSYHYDDVAGNEEVRIDKSSYGLPNHFFRELEDRQYDAKLDLELPLGDSKVNKIKFGGLYSNKVRDFNEYRLKLNEIDQNVYLNSLAPYGQEWGTVFNSYNIGFGFDDSTENLVHFNDTRRENQYNGTERMAAGYAMLIYALSDKVKLVTGARIESTVIEIRPGEIGLDDADTAKALGGIYRNSFAKMFSNDTLNQGMDFLPAINLIVTLSERSNMRLSFSKTIARPNMRELAPFFSFDFLGGYLYQGNPDLQRTTVYNYDFRYELFTRPGEMISASAYYKRFNNPIVKEFSVSTSQISGIVLFINQDVAHVAGLELEYRKNLDVVSDRLRNYRFSTNMSYIYSRVDKSLEEIEAVKVINPDAKPYRPFAGQSPYLFNTNLSYRNDSSKLESNLAFNLFGPRLVELGFAGTPDIMEQPRPTLDFNMSKDFGKHFSANLSIQNILNAKFRTTQNFLGNVYDNDRNLIGRTIGLKVSYKL